MYYGDFEDPFMHSEYCLVQSTPLRWQIGLPLLPNLRQIPLLITPHQTLISSLQLPPLSPTARRHGSQAASWRQHGDTLP